MRHRDASLAEDQCLASYLFPAQSVELFHRYRAPLQPVFEKKSKKDKEAKKPQPRQVQPPPSQIEETPAIKKHACFALEERKEAQHMPSLDG